MNGAFFNALGILLGALFGLVQHSPLSRRAKDFFRHALGASTIFFGLRLVWLDVNGTLKSCLKQIFIALLAIVIGSLIGRILRLQKISNRLGRFAGNLISSAPSGAPRKIGIGSIAVTVLFCAAPLGILGAVADGLSNYFYLLAIKAVMDGLAAISFVKMFGWPTTLSAFPVFVFFGAITLACQFYAKPLLDAHGLTDIVNVTGGLITCTLALVVFKIRKVELANYLPALAVAPLLAWFLNH